MDGGEVAGVMRRAQWRGEGAARGGVRSERAM